MPARTEYETWFRAAAAPEHLRVFGLSLTIRVFDPDTRLHTDTAITVRPEDQIFAIEDTKQNAFFLVSATDVESLGVKRGDQVIWGTGATAEVFEILDVNDRVTGMVEYRCLRSQERS